jgi:hypothetical protein
MGLTNWFRNRTEKFMQRLLLIARQDPEVSFAEYQELEKIFDSIYKEKK